MLKKLQKNYSWNFFFYFFLSKIAIYLSLSLHKGRPSYRRSLQPTSSTSNMRLLTITFFYCCGSFLPSWIRIQSESGSETLRKITYGYCWWNQRVHKFNKLLWGKTGNTFVIHERFAHAHALPFQHFVASFHFSLNVLLKIKIKSKPCADQLANQCLLYNAFSRDITYVVSRYKINTEHTR